MDRAVQAGAVPITTFQYLFGLQQDWARAETYEGVMEILPTHSSHGIQVRFSNWVLGEHGTEASTSVQKRYSVFRINVIFDHYQNRAAVGFDGMSRDRVRPVHGRREIDIRSCLQLPPPREGNSYCRARRCEKQRRRQTQCTEHQRHIHGKTATANPLRQGNLRRDIETGHSGDPGRACNEAGDYRSRGLASDGKQCRCECCA